MAVPPSTPSGGPLSLLLIAFAWNLSVFWVNHSRISSAVRGFVSGGGADPLRGGLPPATLVAAQLGGPVDRPADRLLFLEGPQAFFLNSEGRSTTPGGGGH